ncbi:hypothetical protein [Aurantibacter sp.]|uniref:hypothetical protein n=1 Tax=Aurantibacter sp. TaxID=2807103 RepID=UPI003267EF5B
MEKTVSVGVVFRSNFNHLHHDGKGTTIYLFPILMHLKMSGFIKKIIFFAIAFFVFDKIFYAFLFISPHLESDKRLEKLVNGEINKEIIILGSSRGARNIIAKQIEDSLHLSSFNLSYPGSDIAFQEFLLQTLLANNKKPKAIILTLDDPIQLMPNDFINFRFDRLYPLAKYESINNEMIKRREKNFLSRFLILSRINQVNFNITEKKYSIWDSIRSNGSMPISFQSKDAAFNYDNAAQTYNKDNESLAKIKSFTNFQRLCLDNSIALHLIFPPNYKSHNRQFENRIRQLTHSEVSLFVHDTLNDVYHDKSYFFDERHLLVNGAVVFTNELIDMLKAKEHESAITVLGHSVQ